MTMRSMLVVQCLPRCQDRGCWQARRENMTGGKKRPIRNSKCDSVVGLSRDDTVLSTRLASRTRTCQCRKTALDRSYTWACSYTVSESQSVLPGISLDGFLWQVRAGSRARQLLRSYPIYPPLSVQPRSLDFSNRQHVDREINVVKK